MIEKFIDSNLITPGEATLKTIQGYILPYAVALFTVASALLLTRLLYSQLSPDIFLLFFAAVAISAWYGGMKPGLLASFLSTFIINYFFIPPLFYHWLSIEHSLRLIVFSFVTILISLLNKKLHESQRYLQQNIKKLKISEQRFSKLVDSNIIGVTVADINGVILEANQAFLSILGYSSEYLWTRQITSREIISPEYHQMYEESITQLKHQGFCQPFETEYICKDGEVVPVLVGSTLLDADYQQIMSWVLNLRELKGVENKLRHRENQLELITNAVPGLIAYVDKEHRYRFNNRRYQDWYGLSVEQIYGKHMSEVLGTNVYSAIWPYIKLVLSGQSVSFENQIYRCDGTLCIVSTNYVPQFNDVGEVTGFVALGTDITQEKLAQAALKKSQGRLRTLTERVSVIPWEADVKTGRFTYVGPQSYHIMGYPAEEWYGDNFWQEHIHPEDREWVVNHCLSLASLQDNYEFEYRMMAANGRVVWLQDIVNAEHDGGEIVLLHGFMIDITTRKLAEEEKERLLAKAQAARDEAEAASRIKDEFLATLSHELRTPLHTMLGWIQLLKKRDFNENVSMQALETIQRNAKQLRHLIQDILDVSKSIRGTLKLNIEPVDLLILVNGAMETLQAAAAAKEIDVKCVLENDIGLIMADSYRLQQIVWNLLANAVKFTGYNGKVTVKLSRDDYFIEVSVEDTGRGIDKSLLPYVFDRFRQGDSSTTRSHGGLGLGLAIVRHLVELHGGVVRAESPGIGKGAIFIVTLPVKPALENQHQDN